MAGGAIVSLGKQAVDTPIRPPYTTAPDAAPRQTGPPGKTKEDIGKTRTAQAEANCRLTSVSALG